MTLAEHCNEVVTAAVEAEAWLDHPVNAELVGKEVKLVRRELRRGAMRARKLARAAQRRMAISVFGPSQAGKSFLVSVLARPKDGSLVSNFPDPAGKLDFISAINPEGEGESTGIVTRFTTESYDAPAGFPVKLSLLSEADVARVLVNTFLMDGDKSETEPTSEEIDDLFKRFTPRAGNQVIPGISADDVIETQEYLQKNFSKSTYVAGLSEFWDRAIELAPRLSVADRGELFAVIWGRHETFTRLYVRLGEALQALGNNDTAFSGLDALVPREESIIDVKMLGGIDQKGGATLQLALASGQQTELPKSIVTALTAELVLPMAGELPDLFDGTDLLDFPGARTRFEKPLERFLQEASGPLKECILRGKVAYLFDRYVAEQEITSMLLCVPDSNMEVADLPVLISDWIDYTHGVTPEIRGQAENLLFFVLTKFDKHLIDSAASSDDAQTRFQRRLQASLLEKFAPMEDSWPKAWSSSGAFDNCFWLRNPNFPAESVIEYRDGREISLRSSKTDRLEELRAGCCGAELVKTHFRDPEAAWDAAMTLNDGGVSYLIGNLTPVCRQEVKLRQISAQLQEVCERLKRTLSRFYVSDDYTVRLAERSAAAQQVNVELLNVYNHGHFGALLEELTVSAERIADKLRRPPKNIKFTSGSSVPAGTKAAGTKAAGPIMPGGIIMPGMPGKAVEPPAVADPSPESVRTMTRPAWQAEVAFSHWVETARNFANSEDLHARFTLSPASASEIVTELVSGAKRLDLEGQICRDLEGHSSLERADKAAIASAIVATEHLNAFAVEAGANMVPPEGRPDVQIGDGTSRKPFEDRVQSDDILDLSNNVQPVITAYLTDWMHMMHWLFEENAKETAGGRVNPEENARLGSILDMLEPA